MYICDAPPKRADAGQVQIVATNRDSAQCTECREQSVVRTCFTLRQRRGTRREPKSQHAGVFGGGANVHHRMLKHPHPHSPGFCGLCCSRQRAMPVCTTCLGRLWPTPSLSLAAGSAPVVGRPAVAVSCGTPSRRMFFMHGALAECGTCVTEVVRAGAGFVQVIPSPP